VLLQVLALSPTSVKFRAQCRRWRYPSRIRVAAPVSRRAGLSSSALSAGDERNGDEVNCGLYRADATQRQAQGDSRRRMQRSVSRRATERTQVVRGALSSQPEEVQAHASPPAIDLAGAHVLCKEALEAVKSGRNPAEEKQTSRKQRNEDQKQTVRVVCEAYLAAGDRTKATAAISAPAPTQSGVQRASRPGRRPDRGAQGAVRSLICFWGSSAGGGSAPPR
jgi:hypothetical protein